MHNGRKLELGVDPNLKLRDSDTEQRHPDQHLNCQATYLPQLHRGLSSTVTYCQCWNVNTTMSLLTKYTRILNIHALLLSLKKNTGVDSPGCWATLEKPGWDLRTDVWLISPKAQIQENLYWIFFPKFQPFGNAAIKNMKVLSNSLSQKPLPKITSTIQSSANSA